MRALRRHEPPFLTQAAVQNVRKKHRKMQFQSEAFAVRGPLAFVFSPMFCITETGEKS
jgi:hypothetical protein